MTCPVVATGEDPGMHVIDWLLDSDPAIRWQVLRDLTSSSPDDVADQRARVATDGWGSHLLALQQPDGLWDGKAWSNDQRDTFHVLELLRRFGLDPESPEARRAVGLVREHVTWGDGHEYDVPWGTDGFFEGEVEPCINGNVVATGAYFGVDMSPLVDRLLGEQLPDGGWNCEVENGATVSSFGTTINVLEGLLEHERATGRQDRVAEARRRGDAYLLDRHLLRRKSTGELVDPDFLRIAFPFWWHYDVLRALDYLRDAGVRDERAGEALDVIEAARAEDGRWPIQHVWPGANHIDLEGGEGTPSRWNTLRAMRTLRWFGRSDA